MASETKLFDVPNLDDMSVDASDYETASEVFRKLSAYVDLKAQAIKYRKQGITLAARNIEVECEHIYESLPQWAKW